MEAALHAPLGGVAAISGAATIEPITLNALIDAYIMDYSGRDKARHSRVGWWRVRLGDRVVTSITDEDVFQALEAYANAPARVYAGFDAYGQRFYRPKRTKPADGSVNRHHAALSAVIKWAIRWRKLPRGFQNPARLVERRREKEGRVRFLSADECRRLLGAVKASKWDRLYLMTLMAITTGARRGELGRLTWGDIDFEAKVAHLYETKNADPRTCPLTPAVVDELERFRKQRLDTLVFASRLRPKQAFCFTQHWYAALEVAGIKELRFHDLRHTTASYLAQSGASLLEIADVLGHKDLKMTRRYSHLTVGSKAAVVNRVLGDIR